METTILYGTELVVAPEMSAAPSTLLRGSIHRQLPGPTTDNIEMRVCRSADFTEEDIVIELAEIYIQ